MPPSAPRDRELGMHTAITRRDFVQGAVALAVAGSAIGLAPGCSDAPRTRPSAPQGFAGPPPSGAEYPPSRTGLRGSHDGAFEVAHQMAFERRTDFGPAEETDADYDLVIVGAGSSGLAAAQFARERDPAARILLLDNHDDFGGHAKRNEFALGDRTLLGYGGSQTLEEPSHYSDVAKRLLRDLAVDLTRFDTAYHQGFYAGQGLAPSVYFDRASYGVDRVVRNDHILDTSLFFPLARDGRPIEAVVAEMPISPAARAELVRLVRIDADQLPELGVFAEPAHLGSVSYHDFLTRDLGVREPEVIALLRDVPAFLGDSTETTPALDALALGMPGLGGTGLGRFEGLGRRLIRAIREPYIHHFPDGNASIPRLLVRRLIPGAAAGSTMGDIVTARFDYARLDDPDAAVRLRLRSTVVQVANEGAAEAAKRVAVTYVRDGRTERVHARRCVLACYAAVIPHICPDLPASQRDALRSLVKTPLVYTNVLVRNWSAWKTLGIGLAYCPGSWHRVAMLDFPVSLGDYGSSPSPEDPIVVHMQRTPLRPGLARRDQFRAGRQELLATPYTTIERSIREQLGGMLGGAGFDPASDILAITVNRWPHGYAWSPNSLSDPEYGPGEAPHEIARRRHGRIAIAGSDAGASAYANTAIDEAWRAVEELSG